MFRDDAAEATVISQLLIIGITAGIVFVAATYAYVAVDAAIEEADHAGAQLALRGELHRMQSIAQQGIGASTVLEIPSQGAVSFSPYSPPRGSHVQDRVVVAARPIGGATDAAIDGFGDGDAEFSVCFGEGVDIDGRVRIHVTWHLGFFAGDSETLVVDGDDVQDQLRCRGTSLVHTAMQPIVGVVTISLYENGSDGLLDILVADMAALTVESSPDGGNRAALVGGTVFHDRDHASADVHASLDAALSLRLWLLEGTSYASSAPEQRMTVTVAETSWVINDDRPRDHITLRAYGEHATGFLRLYERLGGVGFQDIGPEDIGGGFIGAVDDRGDRGVYFPDAGRLFVHATRFVGGPLI